MSNSDWKDAQNEPLTPREELEAAYATIKELREELARRTTCMIIAGGRALACSEEVAKEFALLQATTRGLNAREIGD